MRERTGKGLMHWLKDGKTTPLLFFLGAMLLYLTMLADPYFTDEQDIFYGGYNILMSGDLYKNYLSQHMPFSYYMAVLPAALGARTVYWFRVWFYLMMSGIWTAVFVRHRKALNVFALILLPILYVCQLRFHDYATTMISDHWQGIGLVIILLELIRYSREPRIPLSMACMVSLGIVLSLGTTFMSAYPVMILFLGVAILQIIHLVRCRKTLTEAADLREERRTVLREDLRLVGVCLLPWAVLVGWYAVSGNLENAFGCAYTLNTEVYSQYINGMGTQPGGTFIAVFPRWYWYWWKGFDRLSSTPMIGIQILLQNLAVTLCALRLGRKSPVAGITFFLACLTAGVRAFDGFHGGPWMCVSSLALALLCGEALEQLLEKRNAWRIAFAAVSLAVTVFFVAPSVDAAKRLYHLPQYLRSEEVAPDSRELLEILTDEGDRIHTIDLSFSSNQVMRLNLRLDDCCLAASNPWFYTFRGEQELAVLKQNRTKVVLMDPEGSIWGHKVKDYAPELLAYVEENYKRVLHDIFVHKDAVPEVRQRLREAGYGIVGTDISDGADQLGPMLGGGEVREQVFTANGSRTEGIWVRCATYVNKCRVGLTVELADRETGEILGTAYASARQIRDLHYTRFAMEASLEKGREYVLRIRTDEAPEGQETLLHIYRTGAGSATPDCYGTENGAAMDCSYMIQVEYAVDDELNIC